MFGVHDLWLFVLSGLLLNITPGPDTLYILGRSSTLGSRAGAVAALGIGAAYLVYVGISLIRSNSSTQSPPVASGSRPASIGGIFFQGFLTNVLNPKVALFFPAFLPQFVLLDAPSKPLAFLFLGVIFDFNGTILNLLVDWSTARVAASAPSSYLSAFDWRWLTTVRKR